MPWIVAIVSLLGIASTPALAQSATDAAVRDAEAAKAAFSRRNAAGGATSPFAARPVTQTFKGTVAEVRDGAFRLRDGRGRVDLWLLPDEATRLSARNPRSFDGRKRLELSDLEIGMAVKVTVRIEGSDVLRVKVLARGSP